VSFLLFRHINKLLEEVKVSLKVIEFSIITHQQLKHDQLQICELFTIKHDCRQRRPKHVTVDMVNLSICLADSTILVHEECQGAYLIVTGECLDPLTHFPDYTLNKRFFADNFSYESEALHRHKYIFISDDTTMRYRVVIVCFKESFGLLYSFDLFFFQCLYGL
jgi:hypothetical protein